MKTTDEARPSILLKNQLSDSFSQRSGTCSESGSGSISRTNSGLKAAVTDMLVKNLAETKFKSKNKVSKKKQSIMLDHNDAKLKAFFRTLTKNLKIEPEKLMHAIQMEFHEYSEPVFQIIKKAFMNFKHPVDFRNYCSSVSKLISIDIKQIKEMYFTILDLNKDKRICETDLFNSMQ